MKGFLPVTAISEGVTGLGLLLVPAVVLSLLLGIQEPSPEIVIVSRVTGSALLAIGLICALASRDAGSHALLGVFAGILLYDVVIAGLLAYVGGVLGMAGPALWPAVVVHSVLAVWGIVCLQHLVNREVAPA